MTDHPRGAEELGRALDAHALTVAPASPPTRAIIEAARRHTARRRAGGLAACGAAFLAAVVLVTVPGDPPSPPAKPLPAAPPDAPTRSAVRIVAPGERVQVTRDASVWLTEDRRVCDQVKRVKGCYPLTDADGPYVGLVTGTSTSDRQHWIGEFEVPGAARLVVRDAGEAYEGTLITPAGKPGWGAWYVDLPTYEAGESMLPDSLTVYDSSGRILVEKRLSGD